MSTPKRKGPKAIIRELVAALEGMQGAADKAGGGCTKEQAAANRVADAAAEEAREYLDRKPAKRMAVKLAKTEAGKPGYGENILIEGKTAAFQDGSGDCLFVATLRGDTLQIWVPGNNPLRGTQFLDSSLSVSWSAANVVFVDRKRGEIK